MKAPERTQPDRTEPESERGLERIRERNNQLGSVAPEEPAPEGKSELGGDAQDKAARKPDPEPDRK